MTASCAHYGVASLVIYNGRVKHNILVLGPKMDHPHLINSGDREFAEALCKKMRKAAGQVSIQNEIKAYTVVPLPMIEEAEIAVAAPVAAETMDVPRPPRGMWWKMEKERAVAIAKAIEVESCSEMQEAA
ncbi:hypothetical protein KIP88_02835 [Bradyrhizobium sp. SRL28]|uniref:hypothetical protein n=1 Tax=Bradyrhizobium sp. SRL28 TaxID=2836178 RepID=UPI001BDEF0B1|nr:hypothetical protein [Bradyrhizobium sp. SRL28]MBT1509427.1 hypothetical protein [Bradyrhizobium sp. SRL28]